jgi:hypothetical protein
MPTSLTFYQAWKTSNSTPLQGEDPLALFATQSTLYAFGNEGKIKLDSITLTDGTLSAATSLTVNDQNVTGANKARFGASPAAAAAVQVGSNSCLFWNDWDNGLSACITSSLDQSSSPWPWYSVALPNLTAGAKLRYGTNNHQGCDVAASALGDGNTVLVAIMSDFGTGGPNVYVAAYNATTPNSTPGQGGAPPHGPRRRSPGLRPSALACVGNSLSAHCCNRST